MSRNLQKNISRELCHQIDGWRELQQLTRKSTDGFSSPWEPIKLERRLLDPWLLWLLCSKYFKGVLVDHLAWVIFLQWFYQIILPPEEVCSLSVFRICLVSWQGSHCNDASKKDTRSLEWLKASPFFIYEPFVKEDCQNRLNVHGYKYIIKLNSIQGASR